MNNDYTDHAENLILLYEAQDNEKVRRDRVKEARLFITEPDGQWEQYAITKMGGRYRGTFDMCSPVIKTRAGAIVQADFTSRVSPANGLATKKVAKTFDGLIRNIKNISGAKKIFDDMSEVNIVSGYDCCELVHDYLEQDSFNQDLIIKKIANAVDSVWHDQASIEQDKSDSNHAWKLVTIPVREYKKRWPDGSAVSIGDNARNQTKTQKSTDTVTIGKFYYRKENRIEIVEMTDGSVYEVDEKFDSIIDELATPTLENPQGITIAMFDNGKEKRRKVDKSRVYTRLMDGEDWLADEEETVFDYIPLAPIFGNFTIIDDKYVYFGIIEKLYDQQRTFNYANSRDIEDGALGRSEKIAMTTTQIGDNDYSGINTEADPIFEYDNDPNAAQSPYPMPSAQPNAALQTTILNTKNMFDISSNSFNADKGNASSTQSGVAGLQQIEQSNIGTIEWFKNREVMECYISKLIINAAPRVYDGERVIRILGADNSSSFVPINKKIFDEETKTNVVMNDLSLGKYSVVCESGPAFSTLQKETARSIETIMTINPQLAAENMDIYLRNKKEPGLDLMADRERLKLLNAGLIPEEQYTDEEKAKVQAQQEQAANQPPVEDPNLLIGQAEMLKAQTEQQKAQFDEQVKTAEFQLAQDKIALEREKLQLDVAKFQREKDDKYNVDVAKINQGQQVIDQKSQQMAINAQQEQERIDQTSIANQMKMFLDQQAQQNKMINDSFNNLKTMREATGADAIVSPTGVKAYNDQASIVDQLQERVLIFNPEIGDFENADS